MMNANVFKILTISVTVALLTLSCSAFVPAKNPTQGVVTFYNDIPPGCDQVRGLKQKQIVKVTSERQMRNHYGLTFQVDFLDGVSPSLYGVLYYQNADENKFCMALADGRFASFSDQAVTEHKRNVTQKICYPIDACSLMPQ